MSVKVEIEKAEDGFAVSLRAETLRIAHSFEDAVRDAGRIMTALQTAGFEATLVKPESQTEERLKRL